MANSVQLYWCLCVIEATTHAHTPDFGQQEKKKEEEEAKRQVTFILGLNK